VLFYDQTQLKISIQTFIVKLVDLDSLSSKLAFIDVLFNFRLIKIINYLFYDAIDEIFICEIMIKFRTLTRK